MHPAQLLGSVAHRRRFPGHQRPIQVQQVAVKLDQLIGRQALNPSHPKTTLVEKRRILDLA